VLVFSRTKHGADVLGSQLKRAGVSCTVLHGDRDMKERVRALDEFRDGKVRVLVATDVAQRGLDVEGVSHVINYDVPQDPEGYVHRVGRTARAGQKGEAITLMSPAEIGELRQIEYHIGRALPRVELPGYGFSDATEETVTVAATPAPTSRRAVGGRPRMGSRANAQLTPEELEKLLRVG
jgi:ATP-dependent RNA helicase RhlE